jgi:hypothetical protein
MGTTSFTRWLYYDPTCAEEDAHHRAVLKKIDAWWHSFKASAGRIDDLFHQRAQWDLPQWMEDNLQRIHPLGCHIGGGTGLRYSYIDLALTDVKKAIPAIQGRLRQGKVPRRSWILFFDGHLVGE